MGGRQTHVAGTDRALIVSVPAALTSLADLLPIQSRIVASLDSAPKRYWTAPKPR